MTATSFKPSGWTLLFLLLSAMMILMGGAAVAPALPLISQAFPGASETLISLIITLPALAIALTGFFIGALSDKFGKVPVLVASIAVFTTAGSSGFYLNSIYAILVGRFILGMGIAGITCTTSSLIACYYEGITRARVLGYQAAAMGFGVLILETSGGILAGISWRAAFLIYLIGLVILVGIITSMREPAKPRFEEKERSSDETFPASPLLAAYITLFLGNMLFFLLPTKFPFLLANLDAARVIGENTALASGIFLGISGCASSLIGVMYGRIAWRFRRNTILTFTFVFFGAGLCILGFASSLITVGIGVVFIGIGEGILMPTILTWIASITPKQYLGRASGGFSVALNLGQFASTLAIVPVFVIAGTYRNAFLACGCVAFFFALPYLFAILKEKYGFSGVNPVNSKVEI
ncbi:MFS transporter [uncultured Methanospirillum sp.]|uniref:MFS transporter n=1 Tax=uncultured Methanospirillum sp. TaxID=262503 RepID=UPI0029C94135|nr:MFS transporter [uncultured Methanospirillum sp.]